MEPGTVEGSSEQGDAFLMSPRLPKNVQLPENDTWVFGEFRQEFPDTF